ncbi:ethanolamine ammonia-lyase subunit EutC [uncultured Azohydromonas sp.]|jgi:Ethanolamine ammonia-lyase, small subunit|uniref:ethanolamine ammonia-lyase subunit EutC n=1 Tax=uncultured Azohydromonas sp. TaxID=487342 RepID=UPI00262383E0|nr:ethanolamine ammonia-lyase subunit EutC [uncultured Azohydromonas sp.]
MAQQDASDATPPPASGAALPATADAYATNLWTRLRRHTPARIGLPRSGVSQSTAAQLEFQLAHARARDAVHQALDLDALASALQPLGLPAVALHSAAPDRATYLQRPDLGRRLDDASRERLQALTSTQPGGPAASPRLDLALVLADGLSAQAVQAHAPALLAELLPRLRDDAQPWRLAPLALAEQGRVALGDEVGELLDAALVAVLIGERPGLSAPDSLGVYLTWAPRVGCVDAQRNCISNVRPQGLSYALAARRLAWLLREARARGISGVALKDESGTQQLQRQG